MRFRLAGLAMALSWRVGRLADRTCSSTAEMTAWACATAASEAALASKAATLGRRERARALVLARRMGTGVGVDAMC